MRNFFSLVLAFALIMASIPTLSLFYKDEAAQALPAAGTAAAAGDAAAAKSETTSEKAAKATAQSAAETAASATVSDKVRVLLHKDNRVVTVSTEFYIISVLSKEIDIAAPTEALKAQAVCIYTFLKHSAAGSSADYDITDNPATHQSFLSKEALKKFWGETYETNYRKLQKIARSVSGIYMEYGGKPALAAYHSSNAGMTESAENYWGEDYPYLRATESIGDSLSAAYAQKVRISPAAFQKALQGLKGKDFHFPDSPSDWVGAVEKTPSGTVTNIELGGVSLTGRELREALGLKSSFFTLKYQKGQFVLTVSGYGHGVGLSQEGAKYMARLGFSYREILLHYYNGVAIKGENTV
ncbi:MAG: stage II sporulation protein D [Ruminococcaceae bacterium]|nr:stage II sporulation protein D [Oscillospiraceae bacterium]